MSGYFYLGLQQYSLKKEECCQGNGYVFEFFHLTDLLVIYYAVCDWQPNIRRNSQISIRGQTVKKELKN